VDGFIVKGLVLLAWYKSWEELQVGVVTAELAPAYVDMMILKSAVP
jgi:hypothetical protein